MNNRANILKLIITFAIVAAIIGFSVWTTVLNIEKRKSNLTLDTSNITMPFVIKGKSGLATPSSTWEFQSTNITGGASDDEWRMSDVDFQYNPTYISIEVTNQDSSKNLNVKLTGIVFDNVNTANPIFKTQVSPSLTGDTLLDYDSPIIENGTYTCNFNNIPPQQTLSIIISYDLQRFNSNLQPIQQNILLTLLEPESESNDD